ncbi:hypothetical protein GS536_00025 [Rhodococcus hoagii]|nr:hypothetical protein [Prescottella equi]
MKIIDRTGPAFAAFVGAFVAGFAVLASEPNDTIALEGNGGIWLHTTLQWAATAAAVTAVLVYVALRAPTRCPLRLQLLSGSPRRRSAVRS